MEALGNIGPQIVPIPLPACPRSGGPPRGPERAAPRCPRTPRSPPGCCWGRAAARRGGGSAAITQPPPQTSIFKTPYRWSSPVLKTTTTRSPPHSQTPSPPQDGVEAGGQVATGNNPPPHTYKPPHPFGWILSLFAILTCRTIVTQRIPFPGGKNTPKTGRRA